MTGEVASVALTAKQKAFVQEYLVDLNATAAAKRAGYKDPNFGRQLLTKTNVSSAIQKAMQSREQRTEITQDMVVRELAKVAFANGTVYAKVTGGGTQVELTDTDRLTADQRAAISCIKDGKFGIEVSTYDKVRALELLGKHLGLFDKQGGRRMTTGENNLLEIIQGIGEINTDDLSEVE